MAKPGTGWMCLGTAFMAAALALAAYNHRQDLQARQYSAQVLPQLQAALQSLPADPPDPYAAAMAQVQVEDQAYVGYITLPALQLELPVMATWSESQLAQAPCLYAGSALTGDMVIAGHNYTRHFGRLKQLRPGDTVLFCGMDGQVWQYQVALVEVLAADQVEAMTAGEYPLTLFTCTYSGQERLTIRCQLAE